ncbi:hypothetical protein ALC57_05404 [Trachymyrmex cornetzi]|uniref:Phospholipase A2-like domain-containing protein n=1 Tax=Trachymyrmex cornetzi TaxID=471704 RepID=A0A151JAP3_9HYME|nr:hypothetical protein ALC57_05404 [Trachymyrmex cornetzi]
MFLSLLPNKRAILDFTAEQLQYIPKIVLLRNFEDYVKPLWDRLPEHLKVDSEVQRCRLCLLNRTINALPFELHIPGYQFCGPGIHLAKRLARGDRGVNPLDVACRKHDIAYSQNNNLADRHIADRILTEKARQRITASDSTIGEKAAATAIWAAMKTKTKLGMGMPKRKKTRRNRTLPVAKRGGFLLIIPMLGALGSLIGGAARVARAVSDRKKGHGLYLAPYKRGNGIKKRRKPKRKRKKKVVEKNFRDS